MSRRLIRLLSVLISLILFIIVVLKVPAPSSWKEASIFQMVSFLGSVFLVIFFLFRLFLKIWQFVLLFSFGTFMIFVLKVSENLNLLSFLVTSAIFSSIFYLLKKYNFPSA